MAKDSKGAANAGVSLAALQDQIKALAAENAALKATTRPIGLSLKVSEKGALSIYGMRRFPFTFYASEVDALFSDETVAKVRKFRADNAARFSMKPNKE